MALKNNWTSGNAFAAADQNAVANYVNALVSSGLFASLPAAGNLGMVYICSDVGLILRDNGTTWDRIQGGPLEWFTAPPSSGLSTSTLGSATFTADKDARLLTIPTAAGDAWRIEYAALSPTSGYTATAYVESSVYAAAGSPTGGIVLFESGSGKLIHLGVFNNAGVTYSKWNSATSFNVDYVNVATSKLPAIPSWFRIVDDGTNRTPFASFNGVDWLQISASVLRTDFITPTHIGWGANNTGTGITQKLRLRSLKVTTP